MLHVSPRRLTLVRIYKEAVEPPSWRTDYQEMALDMDFSSNRHAATVHEYEVPTRHPELSFEDGNLAIVTGRQYFLVHRGLLCRHSSVLGQSISSLGSTHDRLLEGRSIMTLQDTPEDMVCFLQALYG